MIRAVNSATLTFETESEETRRGNWIQTFLSKKYFPLDPRPEDVEIEDIAHSLSFLCRYNGHIKKFYSVAEHCWIISHVVPPELALKGLLHDASEAYMSDIPRPFKYSVELKKFREVEHLNSKVIYNKFGLSDDEPAIIKEFDGRIITNEKHSLFNTIHPEFTDTLPRIKGIRIRGWSPKTAKLRYLERFNELYKS